MVINSFGEAKANRGFLATKLYRVFKNVPDSKRTLLKGVAAATFVIATATIGEVLSNTWGIWRNHYRSATEKQPSTHSTQIFETLLVYFLDLRPSTRQDQCQDQFLFVLA